MTVTSISTKWFRIFGMKIVYYRRRTHVRSTFRKGGEWA